jgi:hypothetical protein
MTGQLTLMAGVGRGVFFVSVTWAIGDRLLKEVEAGRRPCPASRVDERGSTRDHQTGSGSAANQRGYSIGTIAGRVCDGYFGGADGGEGMKQKLTLYLLCAFLLAIPGLAQSPKEKILYPLTITAVGEQCYFYSETNLPMDNGCTLVAVRYLCYDTMTWQDCAAVFCPDAPDRYEEIGCNQTPTE